MESLKKVPLKNEAVEGAAEEGNKGIGQLPNECLQLILDYLPFGDLLGHAPLVNSKWNEMTKLVCSRKTALNVFGDATRNDLIPEPMTKIFCKYIGLNLQADTATSLNCIDYQIRHDDNYRDFLKRKFPNITTLNVIQFQLSSDLDALYELMDFWPNLCSFRLIAYRCKSDVDASTWNRLFDKISQIPNLRRLAIFCRCLAGAVEPIQLLSFPHIQQLQLGGIPVNLSELRSPVTKLAIYHLEGEDWCTQMSDMNDDVARQINDLTIYPAIGQLHLHYIETICDKFPSVRTLHIRTRLPLAEVLRPLEKLTELSHLRIWHYMEHYALISDIDKDALPNMPQLNSVVMLHLYIRLCHHSQLDWISVVFPRLKWIKLDRFRSECQNCANDKQCEKAFLAPLKKCTQLRRIFLDRKALQIENCPIESLTSYDELSPDELV